MLVQAAGGMRLGQARAGRSVDGELGEEVYQEEEDGTGDRQADSTAVRDDRVSQHLVRDSLQLLSSCGKTLITALLRYRPRGSQFCHRR